MEGGPWKGSKGHSMDWVSLSLILLGGVDSIINSGSESAELKIESVLTSNVKFSREFPRDVCLHIFLDPRSGFLISTVKEKKWQIS